METIALTTFGSFALAAGLLAYVLTANLEYQPEYPPFLTTGMRVVGWLITVAGAGIGVLLLAYAVVSYVG